MLLCLRHLNMSQVLQLGGVNEDIPYIYPQLQHKHFTGCIRNLVVDSKVTHLRTCDNDAHTHLHESQLKLTPALLLINGLITGFNIHNTLVPHKSIKKNHLLTVTSKCFQMLHTCTPRLKYEYEPVSLLTKLTSSQDFQVTFYSSVWIKKSRTPCSAMTTVVQLQQNPDNFHMNTCPKHDRLLWNHCLLKPKISQQNYIFCCIFLGWYQIDLWLSEKFCPCQSVRIVLDCILSDTDKLRCGIPDMIYHMGEWEKEKLYVIDRSFTY